MKLTELLAAVGDERLEFQVLEPLRFQQRKRDGELTFATATEKALDCAMAAPADRRWWPLVVWLPIDNLPEEVRAKLRTRAETEEGRR